MRALALPALLALAAACESDPAPSPAERPALVAAPESAGARTTQRGDPVAAERAANDAAHALHGARLAEQAHGRWTLIARGEVQGSWDGFGEALAAADALAPGHAYLYRPGVDDGDVTFALSPFSAQPRWAQLGHRFWSQFRLTLEAAGDVWWREVPDGAGGTRTARAAWGDLGVRLHVGTADGARELTLRSCASMLFEHDLTLTAEQAAELGLGRYEAPGRAWYAGERWPCRKVVARVRIPELEIDAPAVAFVLPESLTAPR